MSDDNKAILTRANAANERGDYEGFLAHCTDDAVWEFVGDRILRGKQAVRQYMADTYRQPPRFTVERMIAEGDWVTVLGEIELPDTAGRPVRYAYCDVWRFRDGKLAELKAFVITINEGVA